MTMSRDTDALIAELVEGLTPVRPLRFASGIGLALAGLVVTVALVAMLVGLRADLIAGRLDPVFLLANGLFLLLGSACVVSVVTMGRPRVGSDHSGWLWAGAMAALLPLVAGIVLAGRGFEGFAQDTSEHGLGCLIAGTAWGLVTFMAMMAWLRRGAPTSPDRAGLVAGLAAGSIGAFAYSLHCPFNDLVHIGLWHSGAALVFAVIGRVVGPRLLRW